MRVWLRFGPPGFFAVDARMTVRVDGQTVYEGSFMAGFERALELAHGAHGLEAEIGGGVLRRRKAWSFAVPPSSPEGSEGARSLVVGIRYSRLWGTFERDLSVTEVAGFEPGAAAGPSAGGLLPSTHKVRATWALLAVLVVCFVGELLLGVTPPDGASPSLETLVALGGLVTPALSGGQWYRALACTFLHADPLHLLFNGVALFMVGVLIEGMLGWRWLLALYFVGGLGGSAVSLLTNDGTLVSVGASGAIMGLFAAGLFIAGAMPQHLRGPTRFQLARVLIPSLLPFAAHLGERVDFGAHLGGALAGGAVGLGLHLALGRKAEDPSRIARSKAALALSALFVASSLIAGAAVAALARPHAAAQADALSRLLPDDELPTGQPPPERVAAWLQRYPEDPRVRLFAAEGAADAEDWAVLDGHVAAIREALPAVAGVFSADAIAQMERAAGELEAESRTRRELLPNRLLPTGTDEHVDAAWAASLDGWLERYPHDPRVRFEAALRAARAGDTARAEAEARVALAEAPRFAPFFPSGLAAEPASLEVLVRALQAQGRGEEAHRLVEEACGGSRGPSVARYFADNSLCGG